jgi:hypothetical protein
MTPEPPVQPWIASVAKAIASRAGASGPVATIAVAGGAGDGIGLAVAGSVGRDVEATLSEVLGAVGGSVDVQATTASETRTAPRATIRRYLVVRSSLQTVATAAVASRATHSEVVASTGHASRS